MGAGGPDSGRHRRLGGLARLAPLLACVPAVALAVVIFKCLVELVLGRAIRDTPKDLREWMQAGAGWLWKVK